MLTPQEVSGHGFTKVTIGGYNMLQVDEFLDVLTGDYTTLYSENTALKRKMKVMQDKIDEYRNTEETMRKALLAAQEIAENMVQEGKNKTQKLMDDAQQEIDTLRKTTVDERQAEEMRLQTVKQVTAEYVEQVKALHRKEMEYLDSLGVLLQSDTPLPEFSTRQAPSSQGTARQQGQGVPPQQGQGVSPQQGQGVSPQQGQAVSPQQGQAVSPQQGQGMSPQQGHGMSPQQGHGMSPQQGHGMSPQQGHGQQGHGVPPQQGQAPQGYPSPMEHTQAVPTPQNPVANPMQQPMREAQPSPREVRDYSPQQTEMPPMAVAVAEEAAVQSGGAVDNGNMSADVQQFLERAMADALGEPKALEQAENNFAQFQMQSPPVTPATQAPYQHEEFIPDPNQATTRFFLGDDLEQQAMGSRQRQATAEELEYDAEMAQPNNRIDFSRLQQEFGHNNNS